MTEGMSVPQAPAPPDFRCDECKAAELSETLKTLNANNRVMQLIMQEKVGEETSYRILTIPSPPGATMLDIDAKSVFGSSLAQGLTQLLTHGWSPTQFFQEVTPQGVLYRVICLRPLQSLTMHAEVNGQTRSVPETPAPAPALKIATPGDN